MVSPISFRAANLAVATFQSLNPQLPRLRRGRLARAARVEDGAAFGGFEGLGLSSAAEMAAASRGYRSPTDGAPAVWADLFLNETGLIKYAVNIIHLPV